MFGRGPHGRTTHFVLRTWSTKDGWHDVVECLVLLPNNIGTADVVVVVVVVVDGSG